MMGQSSLSVALKFNDDGTVFASVLARVREHLEAGIERDGGFVGRVRPSQRQASHLLDQLENLEQRGGLR